jgi:hypothetical protein
MHGASVMSHECIPYHKYCIALRSYAAGDII